MSNSPKKESSNGGSKEPEYPIITWTDEDKGRIKTKHRESTIYSKKYGLFMYAYSVANQIIQHYFEFIRDKNVPLSMNFIRSSALVIIYPSLQEYEFAIYNKKSNFNRIRSDIELITKLMMKIHFKKFEKEKIDQHDSDFLAQLGIKQRNYKSNCAICLTDDIMGTTCGCGHREIAVFRPCGHSVCVSPCF